LRRDTKTEDFDDVRIGYLSAIMSLTQSDLTKINELIKFSQDEVVSRLMSVLVHFPTRDEVKQMIEDSASLLASKQDLNELKDMVAELREDFEIRDTFTQNRLNKLDGGFGSGKAGYFASPNKPTQR
jgi:hypothetical protein